MTFFSDETLSFRSIAQSIVPLCPTATYNQTVSILAGTTSSAGSTATLLYYPYDLDYDAYRNLYVVDYYNHRVQRFAPGFLFQ